MRLFADLHIHSRFSRGCSKDLTITNLEKWSRIKGVGLLGTSDFQHPEWIKEIKGNLSERDGFLFTNTGFPFVLQTEISFIYTQDGRGRRVHLIVYAPDLDACDQITEYLKKHGRIDYDGRPIFKIPAFEFVENMSSISKDIEVVPAHIWTPWFGMLGEKSGFDSVKECFLDKTSKIHALETGLSSDPEMNWRLSQLDKYTLLSNSDSHSFWPWRVGRECNVFDIKLNYKSLINAIRTKKGLVETIEVDPNYGKYHFDGHRKCNICLDPKESAKYNNLCPKCGKKLTLGVLHRVDELSDRHINFKPADAIGFKKLIPLSDIISAALGKGVATNQVFSEYHKIINDSNEFEVLLNMDQDWLSKRTSERISNLILQNRAGNLIVTPGFDGEYGALNLLNSTEEIKMSKNNLVPQKKLNNFI